LLTNRRSLRFSPLVVVLFIDNELSWYPFTYSLFFVLFTEKDVLTRGLSLFPFVDFFYTFCPAFSFPCSLKPTCFGNVFPGLQGGKRSRSPVFITPTVHCDPIFPPPLFSSSFVSLFPSLAWAERPIFRDPSLSASWNL